MATDTTAANDTTTTTAQDKLGATVNPYIDKAKGFAKDRPFAAAALAGVVGLAILNTIRGK